ncbi:MAG: DUF839 domain-containing protein [Saprospirales bacterium]|jgi:secreted PhoX family phosphatase|nr:DUF839 domain-containing protein [Saprospirales bacterium]MBK7335358.1 DUF839 domain-containing protein [Saprospirales bacterium]
MPARTLPRRAFLEFLGIGIASVLVAQCFPLKQKKEPKISWKPIPPSDLDRLELAVGYRYELLIRWNDPISAYDHFGFNNDFMAFIPLDRNQLNDGFLWVNHEYPDARFISGYFRQNDTKKTREQVDKELYEVGGTVLRVRLEHHKWHVVKDDPLNRRLHGLTEIPFNWNEPIAGSRSAIGTVGNCAGGVTPWGTFLTCEENYDLFYGERDFESGKRITYDGDFEWHQYYDYPPEHYGWVVEVDPRTGAAQKHVALGRCAHECATVKELPDGRVVVYTGDDANDQCLYKFISSTPSSLSEGVLYVANLDEGRWIPIDHAQQALLQKHFRNQTETLIRLREAAHLLGGTALDRPEDIDINPVNGDVLVTLTNNLSRGNYTGSILKIIEKDGKYDALEFRSETFLTGGPETGFACPDNMAFDPAGNLWFTSDISGAAMNNEDYPQYLPFKNNSLFVVPIKGDQAGQVIRIANAPTGAEFTGPLFSPDGKSLFLSVQHPGENTPSPDQVNSHWPDGGNSIPKPAVVVIYGDFTV